MERVTTTPEPPVQESAFWDTWGGVVFFILTVIGSSVVFWHIEAIQPGSSLIILGLGLWFDLVSVIARISTFITGRYSSGFFLVGFGFYLWAWLSYPNSVLLDHSGGLVSLWIRKLPDLACLAVLHLLIHVSFGLDKDENETNE